MIHGGYLSELEVYCWFFCFTVGQVQEKKVKKVCDMNVDPSKPTGNGVVAGSCLSTSSKPYLANGGCTQRPFGYLNNDFSFPSEGIPHLHLPKVVVLSLLIILLIFVCN